MKSINIHEKKLNKAEAFNIVKGILDGELPDQDAAEKLLHYFAPTMPAKPKKAEQWIAKAVAKKDVRENLNYLYSDGVRLMATNGHILFWANLKWEQGYYCPKTFLKIEDDYYIRPFPMIDRVIPKKTVNLDMEITDTRADDKYPAMQINNSAWFNESYIKQAVSGFPLDDFKLFNIDKHAPLYGQGPLGEFVIMPMRT